MEQYFATELNTCCKLGFNNKIIRPHQIIISPKSNGQQPKQLKQKSSKKSLKRIHSDCALTKTRRTNKQTQESQVKIGQLGRQDYDDYGNPINPQAKVSKKVQNNKQLFLSAHSPALKFFNSMDKKSVSHGQTALKPSQQDRKFRYSQKTTPPLEQRANQARRSVNFVSPTRNVNKDQVFYHHQPQTQHTNYQQSHHQFYHNKEVANNYVVNEQFSQQPQTYHPNTVVFAKSPNKNQPNIKKLPPTPQYLSSPKIALPKMPTLDKQILNYSQSFKKIYGEVQIEQEIKKDLMKSLDFKRIDNQQENNYINGGSILTKSPPSEQSTILPPQSKLLKRKGEDQTEAFNKDRKVCTQKYLKPDSQLFASRPQPLRLQGRQKFKSIVSVESQHSSSDGVDSVIIDKHPYNFISLNPIKSLF